MKIRTNSTLFAAVFGAAAMIAAPAMALAQDRTQTEAEEEGDSAQPVNDTWITTKVKTELATTDGVKSTDVTVKTTNGVVALIGVLPTQTAVDKAIAAAKSIKGVKDVDASGLKVK